MLNIDLHETDNGYPTIEIEKPYTLFDEFLRAEHSLPKANRLFLTVKAVLTGINNDAEVGQDYGLLKLNRQSGTATVGKSIGMSIKHS